MEESKLSQFKPKIKLRELKAIQKDQEAYKKNLERMQENQNRPNMSSESNDSDGDEGSRDSDSSTQSDALPQNKPLILDREAKKMQQLELLFLKRELEIKRKQELKDKREQKKLKQQLLSQTPSI